MADGELGAVVEGLAADAGEAAGAIVESAAKLSEQTAVRAEANLARLLEADARSADGFESAGIRGSGDVVGSPLDSGIPLGFGGPAEFHEFTSTLHNGLADAGFGDTRAAFQGSSVTGVSYTKGLPFRPKSDYDIALGGREIFRRAKEVGVPLRSRGKRTGPLNPDEIQALGLTGLRAQLRRLAGRRVEFMIYQSIDEAIARGPSVPA